MKAQDLHKIWDRPDLSRLAKKSTSIRLPVIISAKISALCEMYPSHTKTDIIIDLLYTALEGLEEGFPPKSGMVPVQEEEYGCPALYDDVGIRSVFIRRTNEHIKQLEKELGNDNPNLLSVPLVEKTD